MLFVCTGNQCRSPMAEAMLRRLAEGGCPLEVGSAGTVGDGTPPPEHAVAVMAERGLDIDGRPSRRLTPAVLEGADLIIAMSRQHLVDVATLHPPAFERAFTFSDLLERSEAAGGRVEGESLAQWARRMSAGRTRASVLTAGGAGDVADPMGGSLRDFEQTRDQLESMVGRLAPCLCPGLVPPASSTRRGGRAAGPTASTPPPRRRWWRRGR